MQAPPKGFRPAGIVEWADLSQQPPFVNRRARSSGAQKAGMAYEKKAHKAFAEEFGESYIPGPWFRFASTGTESVRFCQPDALLISPDIGRITIIEYKLRHNPDAWWQMRLLYLPVLSWIFPKELWTIVLCEVVKWYDPATMMPEVSKMVPHIALARPNAFNVHIWKPRGAGHGFEL